MTDDEIRQEAHDEWVKSNTWGLTRDDFIRLSYFHGCMDNGSDGKGPINGSEDRPGDVVYRSLEGSALTRSMVSYWFADSNAFMHGYTKALLKHKAELGRNFGDALQAAFDRGLKAGNEQGSEQQLCIHRLQDEIEAMRKDAGATIPSGWRFYSADFSRGIIGTVMLCRDPAGFVKFHALPIPSAEREAFQLYVSGTGKTFSDAIADAVSEIENPKAPDA